MIRTDGRPTIAMRESESPIPGQMDVDEVLAEIEREKMSCDELHELSDWGTPEPLLGGHT